MDPGPAQPAHNRTPPAPAKARRRQRWEAAFLAALRDTGNVRKACEVAGIARRTPYDLRDRHPDFAEACEDALADAGDLLEQEARRRAYAGVDEPVVYKGELCGTWVGPDGNAVDAEGKPVGENTPGATFIPLTVKKYSDPVLLALLRAYNPRFRDSVAHSHEHKGTVRHKGKLQAEVSVIDARRREFYRALGQALNAYPEAKAAVGKVLQQQLQPQAEGGTDAAEE